MPRAARDRLRAAMAPYEQNDIDGALAETSLRRCLELNPEGKMGDDAEDLLSSILEEDVSS